MKTFLLLIPLLVLASDSLYAQAGTADPARYTPEWIRQGFADAGATHEPWIFQVRRNNPDFNQWQKADYEYQLTEPYIKSLFEAGITVYHVGCYKGFGFQAEKEYMDKVAKAVAIAHKYGMKADTYVQWNNLAYETFFAEMPEAKSDIWYQIDENGKPLMLPYGYQQSFRYRPCFNNDGYMTYYKEKIIRYVVEVVKTDFIHFDNFDLNSPASADFNPATIAAFHKFLEARYSKEQLMERFGFSDVSYLLPPSWNVENPYEKMEVISDPAIQEWIDFRCHTMTSRLAECARFARGLNREIVIEVNPHGLVGSNRAWEAGINHSDLMQYTNVIWTEDDNNPRWENGVAIGKFRHFKLGRTTGNYIMTYCGKPSDFAENLALNRTIGFLGTEVPAGVAKQYLDFWQKNKDLFTNVTGAEKVAVLRSYPSMAYNNRETQTEVNMAEQVLQQRQIPFDIIFDQQLGRLSRYNVIVLADQESLSDDTEKALKNFARDGGGIVMTRNTGKYDKLEETKKDQLSGRAAGRK
ncbi:MAG: beta-galactosidase trimerization domain-containing protein [Bacteroidales bacterium]|nr:beta-galactosidase trimerization domain-containing protein [Bacteroidales bacterium]